MISSCRNESSASLGFINMRKGLQSFHEQLRQLVRSIKNWGGGGGAGKEDYFNIWPVWNTFFETMVGSIWQCRLPTNPLEQFFPQLVGQLVVLTLVISFVAELFFLSMLTLRLACQTTRLSPCTSGLLFWVWALWLLLTFAPDSTIRNQLQNGGPGGGARCKRLEGL